MYLKNTTGFNQQFKAGSHSFTVKPGQTITMTDEEYKDHTVQFLVARGVLKKMTDEEGLEKIVEQAEEKKAKAEENKLEVNVASEDTSKQVIMVQCAGEKKNGERCLVNVRVNVSEYDENKPYFCGRHKVENPDDYERVDGTWKKKVIVEDEKPAEQAESDSEADSE